MKFARLWRMRFFSKMKIKAIFYDFDGVMTDNRALLSESGREYVFVNRSDGLAIGYFKKLKIYQSIISTESNPIVSKRAKKLKISVHQKIDNKLKVIKEILKRKKVKPSETIFIGNDLNDLEVINFLPQTFCPKDSHPEVLNSNATVLSKKGGKGVIMDLYNLIMSGS